jgi:phosphate starvation-inducible PhoH-like protein
LTAAIRRTVTFPGVSIERLKSMLGAYNGHLKQIEQRLDVTISHRGDAFYVDGEMDAVERAEGLLHRLHEEAENTAEELQEETVNLEEIYKEYNKNYQEFQTKNKIFEF